MQSKQHEASSYRTRMCRYWREGTCHRGDECVFAHSEQELRSNPSHKQCMRPRGEKSCSQLMSTQGSSEASTTDVITSSSTISCESSSGRGAVYHLNLSRKPTDKSKTRRNEHESESSQKAELENASEHKAVLVEEPFPDDSLILHPHRNQLLLVCQGVPCMAPYEVLVSSGCSVGVPSFYAVLGLPCILKTGFQHTIYQD